MSDLSTLDIDETDVDESDVLRGSGPRVVDTGVYPVKIDMAYTQSSPSGAMFMFLHLKELPDGFLHKEKFILKTREGKSKDSRGRTLQGVSMMVNLAKMLHGKPLKDLSQTEKMVKLWSYDEQEEVPTKVNVVMDLIGQEVQVALQQVVENRRAPDSNGNWVDTNDKRVFNEVEKFFNKDGQTLAEQKAKEPGQYIDQWRAKNEGKVRDKYKPIPGAPSSSVGAATGGNGAAATKAVGATEPLFKD